MYKLLDKKIKSSESNCDVYLTLEKTNCDYFTNYGLKYCNIYKNIENSLSEKGNIFFKHVRKCLQNNVINLVNQENMNCIDLKKNAIEGHSVCYLNGPISFCDIPITDLWLIVKNPIKYSIFVGFSK